MRLGEIARVARGVVTGNRDLYIMTREEAKGRGLERFVKPIIGGTSALPKSGRPIVTDRADCRVILIASCRDVEEFSVLRDYLAGTKPKVASLRTAPIAASYIGIPRFAANPEGLVITNSLYAVTPRQQMSPLEILSLVERLNATVAKLSRSQLPARYTPRSLEQLEVDA